MLFRFCALLFFLLVVLMSLTYFIWYKPAFKVQKGTSVFSKNLTVNFDNKVNVKLQMKASEIKNFIKKNKFNSTYCFMIDMSAASGKQRFFVYNLKKDSIEMAGLVTHGSGSVTANKELYFSNVPGSNCTSLGKYKIGVPYHGRFGLAYKLHGLETTNNKAFERFVVLHAHSCVPVSEVYPLPICPSLGCPTVAPEFLVKLQEYITASRNPVLLNIYK